MHDGGVKTSFSKCLISPVKILNRRSIQNDPAAFFKPIAASIDQLSPFRRRSRQ